MTETRIYRVANSAGVALVEATSQAQALRHVVQRHYKVDIPKAKEVAELMTAGIKVEQAKTEAAAAFEGQQ